MLFIIAIYKGDQSYTCQFGNLFLRTEFCVFLHPNLFSLCLRMSSWIFKACHPSINTTWKVCLERANSPTGNLWLPRCIFIVVNSKAWISHQCLAHCQSVLLCTNYCPSVGLTLLFPSITCKKKSSQQIARSFRGNKAKKNKQTKKLQGNTITKTCFQRGDKLSLLYFKMHMMCKCKCQNCL